MSLARIGSTLTDKSILVRRNAQVTIRRGMASIAIAIKWKGDSRMEAQRLGLWCLCEVPICVGRSGRCFVVFHRPKRKLFNLHQN